MALGETKRQTNPGLDRRMRAWVDWIVRLDGSSLTQIMGAAVAVLYTLPEEERTYYRRWSGLIDAGTATWQQFTETCLRPKSERLDILDTLMRGGAATKSPEGGSSQTIPSPDELKSRVQAPFGEQPKTPKAKHPKRNANSG